MSLLPPKVMSRDSITVMPTVSARDSNKEVMPDIELNLDYKNEKVSIMSY